MSQYRYNAKLNRIIDGDSLILDVDLGFRVIVSTRFRMSRIKCQELNSQTPEEKVLAHAAKKWLDDLFLDDKSCVIESKRTEKYGRWLAEVYKDGKNINDEMLTQGLAQPYK